MKLLKRVLPLSLMLLAVSACNSPTPSTSSTDFDAQHVVNTANEQWNAAFNASDLDALVELYAAQATLSPGDGNVLNGQSEIGTLFQGFFDNGLHNHQIETLETYAAPGQVSQLANWSADVVDESGETVTFQGILITVLQQNSQEAWEVVSHVWNMAQ